MFSIFFNNSVRSSSSFHIFLCKSISITILLAFKSVSFVNSLSKSFNCDSSSGSLSLFSLNNDKIPLCLASNVCLSSTSNLFLVLVRKVMIANNLIKEINTNK